MCIPCLTAFPTTVERHHRGFGRIGTRAPPATQFLAVDAGEQRNAAVRARALGDQQVARDHVDIKAPQEVGQHGEGDARADEQSHQRS